MWQKDLRFVLKNQKNDREMRASKYFKRFNNVSVDPPNSFITGWRGEGEERMLLGACLPKRAQITLTCLPMSSACAKTSAPLSASSFVAEYQHRGLPATSVVIGVTPVYPE